MILIVDDSKVARITLAEHLAPMGHPLIMAADGEEAWELLCRGHAQFLAVLLDRVMPRMDGMEVLRRMQAHPGMKNVPVIMQTARHEDHEIREGIQAGAYYYLTKPYSAGQVKLITAAAIADFRKYNAFSSAMAGPASTAPSAADGHYTFRTPEEAEVLSKLLAQRCPAPPKAAIGLWELLINAVEHGNLGITYREKSKLMESGGWEREILRRLSLPAYSEKKGTVFFERKNGEIKFHIRDEGDGFDWKPYLQISPERAFDTHGRGIAISKEKFFDQLEYMGRGNEVVAIVKS